jgi:hypothetical protein
MTKLKSLLEEKPREYWIVDFPDGKRQVHEYKTSTGLPFFRPDGDVIDNNAAIHVVDAAYAASLRDELERCVKALDMARNVIQQMYCGRYGCGSTVGFSTTVPLCLLCKEKSELARNEINKLLGGGENE